MNVDRRLWECPECSRQYRIPAGAADPGVCIECRRIRTANRDRTRTCPHCGHDFGGPPKGKRKCPTCSGKLIRWKDWDAGVTLLVTDAELREIQRKETRKHARKSLLELKELGLKRAKIIAAMDRKSCEACLEADGDKWPVETALRMMPIPHDGEGHCRCSWSGVW